LSRFALGLLAAPAMSVRSERALKRANVAVYHKDIGSHRGLAIKNIELLEDRIIVRVIDLREVNEARQGWESYYNYTPYQV
jgi:hypothetical protein